MSYFLQFCCTCFHLKITFFSIFNFFSRNFDKLYSLCTPPATLSTFISLHQTKKKRRFKMSHLNSFFFSLFLQQRTATIWMILFVHNQAKDPVLCIVYRNLFIHSINYPMHNWIIHRINEKKSLVILLEQFFFKQIQRDFLEMEEQRMKELQRSPFGIPVFLRNDANGGIGGLKRIPNPIDSII